MAAEMTEDTLSKEQAFLAMFAFLENYYAMTTSNDVGALLGSLSLLRDGGTADPAMAKDWADAVSKAKEGRVDAALSLG